MEILEKLANQITLEDAMKLYEEGVAVIVNDGKSIAFEFTNDKED